MGDTEISWTDKTWNPVRGCSRVIAAGAKQSGCGDGTGGGCYAERTAGRFGGPGMPYEGLVRLTAKGPRWTGVVRMIPEHLADPLRWRKPARVFVNSMSDLFHDGFSNEEIASVFGVMAACPQHTFQILTKRPERMRAWFEWAEQHGNGQDVMRFGPSALLTCAWEACSGDVWGDVEPPGRLESLPSPDVFGTVWPLPNVWIGTSVENQEAADERIEELLACPAAVYFLSCEPLLGPLDLGQGLRRMLRTNDGRLLRNDHPDAPSTAGTWRRHVDWAIVGAESGPGARPMDVAWARSIRDQFAAAGVAFFLKQLVVDGKLRKAIGEFPADLRIQDFPTDLRRES